MKATVVGLVTPHVLHIMDLAKQAETGINVDWHLRDAVTKTVNDLGQQFNAGELLVAYVHGLKSAAREVGQAGKIQVDVLQAAAVMAVSHLNRRD